MFWLCNGYLLEGLACKLKLEDISLRLSPSISEWQLCQATEKQPKLLRRRIFVSRVVQAALQQEAQISMSSKAKTVSGTVRVDAAWKRA